MDAAEICLPKAHGPQPGVDALGLAAAAHHPDVPRRAAQGKGLALQISVVAVGHDAHIILPGQRRVRCARRVQPHLCCGREPGFVGKLRPILQHHTAELRCRQHRHQRLRHMPAAKNIHGARGAKRQCKHALPAGAGGSLLHRNSPGILQHQPTGPVVRHGLPCVGQSGAVRLAQRQKQQLHAAAAHHARVAALPQIFRFPQRLSRRQHLAGGGNGAAFHRAAAHRAAQPPFGADCHHRARAPRHRALRGCYRYQHGGQVPQKRFQKLFHRSSSNTK